MTIEKINVISGTPESGTWSTFHASVDREGKWLTIATIQSDGTGQDIISISLSDAPVIIKMMTDACQAAASVQLVKAKALADLFAI